MATPNFHCIFVWRISANVFIVRESGTRASADVLGYENDETQQEYRDDTYEVYQQDNPEYADPVRFKRFEKPTVKTLSPQEIQDVRGAINQILSGYNQNNPFTPLPPIQGSNEKRSISDKRAIQPRDALSQIDPNISKTQFKEYTDVIDNTKSEVQTFTINEALTTNDPEFKSSTAMMDDNYETESNNDFIGATINSLTVIPVIPGTNDILRHDDKTYTVDEIISDKDVTTKMTETINDETETNIGLTGATINVLPVATMSHIGHKVNNDIKSEITNILGGLYEPGYSITSNVIAEDINENKVVDAIIRTFPTRSRHSIKFRNENEDEEDEAGSATKQNDVKQSPTQTKVKEITTIIPVSNINTAVRVINTTKSTVTIRKSRTRTTRTTTTRFNLDVPALLALIANLTYDYEMNLTDNLNDTLLKYSIPTCETPTTTVKKGLFIDYEANATGTIVAKCFVCGLEVEKIPHNAHCADAFAGDFLPLVPVDMTARGKISKFRKYCRYADVPHYMVNASQPRSVFGRWSGGCSVRWIDLSGVYTQRSCRSKERAIMGRNFASKRMAKLEMALGNVENGCITSPMATLVPLSRGISLYARFHACVCTGSWCNRADIRVAWMASVLIPLLVAFVSPHLLI